MDDLQNDIGLGILVAWLIVSVVFGAIGAAMASEKGASGGVGFLVGFLFNAVGLIIVMLMSPSVAVEARRRIAVEREMARLINVTPAGTLPLKDPATAAEFTSPRRKLKLDAVVYGSGRSAGGLKVVENRIGTPNGLSGALYESGVAKDIGIWLVWPEGGERMGNFSNPHRHVSLVAMPLDQDGAVLELMRLAPQEESMSPQHHFVTVLFLTEARFKQVGIPAPERIAIMI